ncbi:MAG: membrane protein insertase YidC [Gemmatimonadetes bacterium]|nr:membrane protein insertase YidC [Gemmatimonadota bacterium]
MELRFLLAIVLMVAVIVITNIVFPPEPPRPAGVVSDTARAAPKDTAAAARADTLGRTPTQPAAGGVPAPAPPAPEVSGPVRTGDTAAPEAPQAPGARSARVEVEGPLYRFVFDTRGVALVSGELLGFRSFQRPGAVQLVPEGARDVLAQRILVGSDTIDLRGVLYEPRQPGGLVLEKGGPATLRFTYRHPEAPFGVELDYTFHPDSYVVAVSGRVQGLEPGVLLTELGPGVEYNEANRQDDVRALAYVVNHQQRGIRSEPMGQVTGTTIEEGPFSWIAVKSKYFVMGMLAGASPQHGAHLAGLIARERADEGRAEITVTQPLRADGTFAYRLFLGPQDYGRMAALGQDFEEVNPYGWRVFRPIIRPFVAIITTVLIYMHRTLHLSYGWVLILFGLLMRIVLWPLNQKAMRAQLKNMAVQPLLKEIQDKYKNNPEKLQQEMLKLYREHGFNPMAGCLPMLLPWPILIALFFVFQNTIEFRGVGFLWLPDLSRPDPIYLLPIILGISMFALQWVSMRTMPQANPQMKMMMWLMPGFMVIIFLNLASGLNLYYAISNVASLPQQYWIAKERAKIQPLRPVTAGR